jgi:alpha-L-fucosidase
VSRDGCIQLLVKVVSQDGNLLPNVGPGPNGSIEPAGVQRLTEIGDYLKKYGESIYCTSGVIYDDKLGGPTATDKAIYVHVLKVPSKSTLKLPPFLGRSLRQHIYETTEKRHSNNRRKGFRYSMFPIKTMNRTSL